MQVATHLHVIELHLDAAKSIPVKVDGNPSCKVHPLNIGRKADSIRFVFNVVAGASLNASIIDMGDRFPLLVNKAEAVKPTHDLPKIPVAKVLCKPLPDMQTAGTYHNC